MEDALRLPELRGINRGLRILLVEDSESDASIIQDILEDDRRVDWVRHVVDGDAALETLNRIERPDLIITDMKMPVKDGFDFLIDLRSREGAAGDDATPVPVVVLTSSDRAIDFHKATLAEANSFMTKPSDYRQLKSGLRRLVHSLIWGGELPRMLSTPEDGAAGEDRRRDGGGLAVAS